MFWNKRLKDIESELKLLNKKLDQIALYQKEDADFENEMVRLCKLRNDIKQQKNIIGLAKKVEHENFLNNDSISKKLKNKGLSEKQLFDTIKNRIIHNLDVHISKCVSKHYMVKRK